LIAFDLCPGQGTGNLPQGWLAGLYDFHAQ
jgi:hypothetical protein